MKRVNPDTVIDISFPEIRQVRRFRPAVLTVVRIVLAQHISAMGGMKLIPAKPPRVGNLAGNLHFMHVVFVAAVNPFIKTKIVIKF